MQADDDHFLFCNLGSWINIYWVSNNQNNIPQTFFSSFLYFTHNHIMSSMDWSIGEVKSWLANTLQLDEQIVRIFEGKKIVQKRIMYTYVYKYKISEKRVF